MITEVALLLLLPGIAIEDAALRSKLSHAKTIMQDYGNRAFYYMQQVENPSNIYIIGEWASLDQHLNQFIPGPENQAVLQSLNGSLTVERLMHIDVPHADLPLPKNATQKEQAYRGDLVWSIVRHFVKCGEKEDFQQSFDENKHYLQDYVTEGTIGGGWRIDKEDNKEEFVLFEPWKDVQQHVDFAETEGFKKYGQIREYIDGADIKHAKLLDI